MTLNEIESRVRAIRDESGDDERAHSMEDDLHQDVLRAIASGDLDCSPSAAAQAALVTTEMAFARWCA